MCLFTPSKSICCFKRHESLNYSGWKRVLFIRNIHYLKNVFCFGFTNDRFYIIFYFRYFFFFFFASLVTKQFFRYTTGTCVLFSMTAVYIAHTLVEHFSFPFKKCFVVEKTHPTQYVSMKIPQHGNWTLDDTV